MPTTPRINLPLIAADQAQKHVPVNESLALIDAISQIGVTSVLSTPPATPAEGDLHQVGPSATADWAGWDDSIALYTGGSWVELAPKVGWLVWDEAAGELRVFRLTGWTALITI